MHIPYHNISREGAFYLSVLNVLFSVLLLCVFTASLVILFDYAGCLTVIFIFFEFSSPVLHSGVVIAGSSVLATYIKNDKNALSLLESSIITAEQRLEHVWKQTESCH